MKSRSPHGERGLKSLFRVLRVAPVLSLPTRGAWIEIPESVLRSQPLRGRSPHGERGLKFIVRLFQSAALASLPTRGAWIEIMR
mgnify:CR=1 FL=1